ncbi:hypothetical protein JWJ90_17555 [Desulfobulbus rhabdoformis]|uniref:type II toxin-antitoxin system RelE family toxin n=1 Tax=Desulfobulbus rhabdoformis TaxID=34032 RepID=UPI00196605EF|nr:hypothetical protein [Desulfobulbus rhabdoformis]MBM9616077.1 hypothetical protein [Desulfobulbus rhabdoformis]
MAGSEVLFKDSVYKDLRRIPKTDLERILARIEQLGLDPLPPGSLKLTGAELCRVRQGATAGLSISDKRADLCLAFFLF